MSHPSQQQGSQDPKETARVRDYELALKATKLGHLGLSEASEEEEEDDSEGSEEPSDDVESTDDDEDEDEEDESEETTKADKGAGELSSKQYSAAQKAFSAGDISALAKALGQPENAALVPNKKAFKALKQLEKKTAAQTQKLEADKKASDAENAKDRKLVDDGIAKLSPILDAISHYKGKAYHLVPHALQQMFGDDLPTIMKNLYKDAKVGPEVSALKRTVENLEHKLTAKEQADKDAESKQTRVAEETKRLGTFSKTYGKHPLKTIDDDDELMHKAYKTYIESFDTDLNDYTMTRKDALDQVYAKEQKRIAKATGKAPAEEGAKPIRAADRTGKAYKDMTREEKRDHDMRLAMQQTKRGRNDSRQA